MTARVNWISKIAATTLLMGMSAHAADIDITLKDVKESTGNIRLVLFNSESSFNNEPTRSISLPALEGEMPIILSNLPVGQYAVLLYQDIDGNEVLNTNLLGIPCEPWGASLNGRLVFGPPDWKGTRFDLPASGTQITIQLR